MSLAKYANCERYRRRNLDKYRAYQAAFQVRRGVERRALVDELVGSICALCGADAGLHTHHVDPTIKDFDLLGPIGLARPETVWRKEAEKCVRLCRSCHNEARETF